MVDVAEHVYDDDPERGHPDVRTRLAGASYYFLGNGLIQAAVQHAPRGDGTPLGLLVMNPDRLRKKRDALTMHPARGLEPTMVRVVAGEADFAPPLDALAVSWQADAPIPTVAANWDRGGFRVEEQFCCPSASLPRVARAVTVLNARHDSQTGTIRTGPADSPVDVPFSLAPGERAHVWLIYDLDEPSGTVRVGTADVSPVEHAAVQSWAPWSDILFGDPVLDHLFRASRAQLPAAVSSRGRLDGSIWQYNREWVRDQALVALALTHLGRWTLARTILQRLATEFVTADGATLDSSEVRERDDVELDQNGVLLYVLGEYVAWTGDATIVADLWDRVIAVAEYPLRPEFRHAPSGMLCGTREFWERHAAHGIKPGLELAHQMFVSVGLASAARLARQLGRTDAALRWQGASDLLRDAMLSHPEFALSDARGFIKRRSLAGPVQETIVARPGSDLPDGVPLAGEPAHLLNPDTCCVLPIVHGVVAPRSAVAQATLKHVEALWNQAWHRGGYGRYDVSSEPDSPGAWPLASVFVARAAIEAGEAASAWRTLRWLGSTDGAEAGSWFEFNGPRIAPPFPQVGVIPWVWAELITLFVHHVLGVRPGPDGITVRPRLLPGVDRVEARLPVRDGWLHLHLHADPGAPADEVFRVPYQAGEMTVAARVRPLG
jgi:hypothetical protein